MSTSIYTKLKLCSCFLDVRLSIIIIRVVKKIKINKLWKIRILM